MTARAISRRQFVLGVAGGAATIGGLRNWSWGSQAGTSSDEALSGSILDLSISEMPVNITGKPSIATTVNGRLPAPLLRMRQGEDVTIRVRNRLAVTTSIHWHGFILPADMDGVPGISFAGIAPGATFDYRFRVNQSGTYWYHSHSRFQEQTGLYGPIIVERRSGERHASDREHVILLSDWTDLDPERIYATLKKQSDYYNRNKRTARDLVNDTRARGLRATAADRRMWGQMRMEATDLADVTAVAYTYLMNGHAPAHNWTGLFQRGERVRLRFINGSSMSFFDVRIPGLKLTVVAADGQDVDPVSVDEFRIGVAEVLDVIVQPDDDRAYTIFAQSMDRSGFARGTLAPRTGMTAEVPPLEPRYLLTMDDMGMDHAAMDHAAMGHTAAAAASPREQPPQHSAAEYGPAVDSVAARISSNLDDPGPGLRDNGRRVLTYGDLHTIGGAIDERDADREIELHLTGHMERYMWSFNGQKFSRSEPLRFAHGERLRIVLVNDTMMTHPIHLHGMWSEVVSAAGEFRVRKHTVSVLPAQRVSYLVTADALGRWAYHCHLLYHMEAGMFREVIVAHAGTHS